MSIPACFFDTNILFYLLSVDEPKADRAEELLADGGVISVQVLNEFASVAARKLNMPWADIRQILAGIRAACQVEALTEAMHECGLDLAQRYGFSFYDATIAAAALLSGCSTLYTEDFHHGLIIEGKVTIVNPFRDLGQTNV